jgi:hypothetical protein
MTLKYTGADSQLGRYFRSSFTIVRASLAVSLPTLPLEYMAWTILPSGPSINPAGWMCGLPSRLPV